MSHLDVTICLTVTGVTRRVSRVVTICHTSGTNTISQCLTK